MIFLGEYMRMWKRETRNVFYALNLLETSLLSSVQTGLIEWG